MATIRQIEANRRNSQKSTGPRTEAGKAVSSMNALKSGIDAQSQVIRGEDPDELQALKAGYYESLNPTCPEEAALVDAVIAADWLLRRLRKAEADIWNREFDRQDARADRLDQGDEEFRLAAAFEFSQAVFMRLQRRLDAAERSLHRSLAELRRLRHPRPVPASVSPIVTKPEIGFVPSPVPDPLPAARSRTVFSALPSASPRLRVEKNSQIPTHPLP